MQVANTLESLDQVENSLTKRIVADPSLASYIDSSSVDIKQNRIVLALSPSAPAHVAATLKRQYPPTLVNIVQDTAAPREMSNRSILSGRYVGGEWISNKDTGGACTLTIGNATGTDGHRFAVTAGHCGNGNYYRGKFDYRYGIAQSHNNDRIGKTSSSCDCVLIGAISNTLVSTQVLVANNALFDFTQTGLGSYPQGLSVCLSGASSAEDSVDYPNNSGDLRCGEITRNGGTETCQGFTLVDPVLTNVRPISGDSGGPLGHGGGLVGIAHCSDGSYSKASHLQDLAVQLSW